MLKRQLAISKYTPGELKKATPCEVADAPMTVITYRWTVDRYHQAVEVGVFDEQPVELLRGEIVDVVMSINILLGKDRWVPS